jgi:hypothetical protein
MNTPTVDQAKFCPQCLSPLVEYGTIIAEQAPAKCLSCNWAGNKGDLLTSTFVHEMGDGETMMREFVNGFRNILAKECAVTIGRWLMRWGFLPRDQKDAAKALAKYMQNLSTAALVAILKTREELVKGEAHEPPKSA